MQEARKQKAAPPGWRSSAWASELGAASGAEVGDGARGRVAAVGALGDRLGSAAVGAEIVIVEGAAGAGPLMDVGDAVVDGVLLGEGARGDGEGEVGAALEGLVIN